MENLQVFGAGFAAIILFIFGLENFSREIEHISGERFRKFLGSATKIPIVGVLIGALVTGLIQSSSATSVITISLVNAGVLSFKNSVGIIFGSNIGTTVTAQLVAFKLTAFAPWLLIAGFAVSLLRNRYSVFGKAIFYFGFVFFSLNLISSSLSPLQHNEALIGYLTQPHNPLLAIMIGCVFTAAVQSSSVTTGLAIIFVQQGLLTLETAVPLIMGANIGTTATALIAMFQMDIAAKKTALAHFLFNVGGVLAFIPLLFLFAGELNQLEMEPAIALALIHLVFNLVTTLVFVIFINQFTQVIDFFLGEGKMDFERLVLPKYSEAQSHQEVQQQLNAGVEPLFRFLRENYSLVTLAIEANYKGITDAAAKRLDYLSFVKRETTGYFAQIISVAQEHDEVMEIVKTINLYDYLFQIQDSIADIFDTKQLIDENYVELQSDILIIVRKVSAETLDFFDDVSPKLADDNNFDITKRARELQEQLNEANSDLLRLMASRERADAGKLANYITYSQRLKDKLVNFHEVSVHNL